MRWCASAFGTTFVRIPRAMRALAEGAEMSSRQTVPDADPLELLKIVTLERVTELTTLSADSLKRHHAGKVRRLGPRRLGMRLGDALAIGESMPRALPAAKPRKGKTRSRARSRSPPKAV